MEKFIPLDDSNQLSISHFKTGKGDKKVKVTKMWKPGDSDDFVYTKIGFSLNEEQSAKFLKRFKLVFEDLENAEELKPKKSKKKSKDNEDD